MILSLMIFIGCALFLHATYLKPMERDPVADRMRRERWEEQRQAKLRRQSAYLAAFPLRHRQRMIWLKTSVLVWFFGFAVMAVNHHFGIFP